MVSKISILLYTYNFFSISNNQRLVWYKACCWILKLTFSVLYCQLSNVVRRKLESLYFTGDLVYRHSRAWLETKENVVLNRLVILLGEQNGTSEELTATDHPGCLFVTVLGWLRVFNLLLAMFMIRRVQCEWTKI